MFGPARRQIFRKKYETSLKNVESIMLFIENNPQPLSSGYNLTSKAVPSIGTRVKMGKTSNVIAAVKSDGKVYITDMSVRTISTDFL